MKIFLDSANVDEIGIISQFGIIDGITTNPSSIASSGRNVRDLVADICKLTRGPVSVEVTSLNADAMIADGLVLSKIAQNVCVKLPMNVEGIKACRKLSDAGIMVNMTLCFSVGQAILAAKSGATFVSPFVGRLDDISANGMDLVVDIRSVYDNYPEINTQILVSSVRHVMHIVDAAKVGANAVTAPGNVIMKLFEHPMTNIGLDKFIDDYNKSLGR